MRFLLLYFASPACVGALVGAIAGWLMHFPGGWGWWVGGGAVVAEVCLIIGIVILVAKEGIAIPALALAAALAALHPVPARADGIARLGDDWVRIMAAECKNEAVVAAIRLHDKNPAGFFAAAGHIAGHDFAGCWMQAGEHIYLVWEDGDEGLVPNDLLKPAPVS